MIYRIKDWKELFEKNRTKELKHMFWVPIPNKQDGDGYTELVTEHENGPGHYAVWIAVVLIGSKCDPRGTLLRDGQHPHTPQTVARKSRLPAGLIKEAFPRLLDIGWLELIEISQHDAEISQLASQGGEDSTVEKIGEEESFRTADDADVPRKAFSQMSVAEKRSALWQECLRQSGESVEGAEVLLKAYSRFEHHDGIRNVRSLKEGWLDVTLDKAFVKADQEAIIRDTLLEVNDA